MGLLAVSVLSGFKFWPNLINIEMASKFLLRVSDISEKVLKQSKMFELHSVLQC